MASHGSYKDDASSVGKGLSALDRFLGNAGEAVAATQQAADIGLETRQVSGRLRRDQHHAVEPQAPRDPGRIDLERHDRDIVEVFALR